MEISPRYIDVALAPFPVFLEPSAKRERPLSQIADDVGIRLRDFQSRAQSGKFPVNGKVISTVSRAARRKGQIEQQRSIRIFEGSIVNPGGIESRLTRETDKIAIRDDFPRTREKSMRA